MLWVIITITAGQHNHRWTEGAIVDYMGQHPSRAYFSRLFRNGGLRTGMEVGVADGRFSEHFLLDAGDRIRKWYMVEPAPNAELVARFPAASLASTSAAASSPGLLARLWSRLWNGGGRSWQSRGIGTRTEIIHLPHLSLDPNIFSTVPPRSVDFIYIDSSHLYEVTKKELSAYWQLLRRGGLLAGHDYCDHGESATTATSHVCRGCHPVPRCLPYTEYGLAHGKPLGAPSKSQTSVVKAVQEWVVLNGRTLHFTSETFTRSNLRADGMEYDLLLTSTRNPSWFVVKGRGNNIEQDPIRSARSSRGSALLHSTWDPPSRAPLTSRQLAAMDCPRTFVYQLPTRFSEVDMSDGPRWTSAENIDEAFGRVLLPKAPFGELRETNQWSLARIVISKVMRSTRCRTRDAAAADVFIVPVLIAPKHDSRTWSAACSRFTDAELEAALPHLNEDTASRHLLILSKGHYNGLNCSWFANPPRGSLLAKATRVAYSAALDSRGRFKQGTAISLRARLAETADGWRPSDGPAPDKTAQQYWEILHDAKRTYPRLFSVPYPSSCHWTRASLPSNKRHRQPAERPLRILFIGSTWHGDVPVRELIRKQCTPPACMYHRVSKVHTKELLAKSNATFCLEPGGDSPFRKSLSDSIALGCIPVLFHSYTDAVAPWMWGDWKHNARVMVPRADFLNGLIKLQPFLAAIPPSRVANMQATLAVHRRKFQFSSESLDNAAGDAVHIMLAAVKSMAV